jgi:hypothetical protein
VCERLVEVRKALASMGPSLFSDGTGSRTMP